MQKKKNKIQLKNQRASKKRRLKGINKKEL